MTNAEKLAKELLENLDDFAGILHNGTCPHRGCSNCELRNLNLQFLCHNEKAIKVWLKSEVKEDAKVR